MEQNSTTIEVIDKDGWRKSFSLNQDKTIILIGSDSNNDVILESHRGRGVAPRHLQLILSATADSGCRLVNLADTDVLVGEAEQMQLAPHSYVNIAAGERVRVGDFSVVFHLDSGLGAGASRGEKRYGAKAVGLRVSLSQTQLTRHQPLEGVVTLRNQGDKAGVQFKLELEGLSPESYEMEPGPILFAGAEKDVLLRLHPAKRSKLRAGEHHFAIHATAPEAYPGEGATSLQVVQVLPFYQHSLRLVSRERGSER
ncbi:MAG: FHA domain-containing protein [Anaerolineae bacterium]